jgi:protein involved in polysaccharide export with SLBB domain
MSQSEIDRRLKELGMTLEEAIQRAKENGISIEDYLARTQAFPTASDTTVKPIFPALQAEARLLVTDTARAASVTDVPGFVGRSGMQWLKPFGYEVFNYPASTFQPVFNVATPPSYVLGPGDEVVITVWGETKLFYQLSVNREGNLLVPEVGPVSASGQTIQQFREKLLRRMTSAYSGLKNGMPGANSFLDVSIGKTRTLQVFVLGEVVKPGGYSISSMSTAFHAIYFAGGPTVNGTMRDVQLVRTGEQIPPIDFYDYLIRGDRTKDPRLQDGDVVFVKPAGKRAAITGRILRPAIYEVRERESLGDLLSLAGGLLVDSYTDRIHIERIIPFDQRKNFAKNILDVDLEFVSKKELMKSPYALEDGDIVSIQRISDLPQNRVSINGNVRKPGVYEWKPGLRIRDLILLADSLQRNTFSERGTLFRLLPNLRREIYPFNPRLAIDNQESDNLLLQNEDSLVVYKESQFYPTQTVRVSGAVRNPGTFTRFDKMTAGDLVVLAGGLTEGATLKRWEVARIDSTKIGVFSKIFRFDVQSDYWNNANGSGFVLADFDQLAVPFDSLYSIRKSVTISGRVMYPGSYAIRHEQEKVSDIIQRAGGLKPGYYLEGSRLIRKANGAGLVPINFKTILDDPKSIDNLSVLDGDVIEIAEWDNVVYVRGEVFVPSAVVYKKGASLGYYITQAGGYKEEADDGKTVVSLPNGRKREKGWFIFPDPEILGGSTILVPKKIEKEDKTLPIIRDMATMLASIAAITVALIQVTK